MRLLTFGLLLLLLLGLGAYVESGNVLVFTMLSKSQLLHAARLATVLADDGHNVTIVLPTNDAQDVKPSPKYNLLFYKTQLSREMEKQVFTEVPNIVPKTVIAGKLPDTFMKLLGKRCEGVLFDDEFQRKLIDLQPDVAIVHIFMSCVTALLNHINVPFMDFCPIYMMHSICGYPHNVPAPPSYVPDGTYADEPKTFLDRVWNTVVFVFAPEIFPKLLFKHTQEEVYKYQIKHNLVQENLFQLRSKASILLVNGDVTFESVRPALPKVFYIGGIQCDSPNPLPDDIRDFVESGDSGLIVFSLGGVLNTDALPHQFIKSLLKVFKYLPQRVVWKLNSVPAHLRDLVPNNVKIVNWMPQQDLLGHPKTVLFISHGGIQGSFESICHAIPTLGIYIFADQRTNIKTLVNKGMALMIEDYKTVTEDEVKTKLHRLLSNSTFKEKAMQARKLYFDQPLTAAQRLTFAVGYVIRHKGARHLTSIGSLQLNRFQYYSLDVYLFLLLVFLIILFLLYALISTIINCLIILCKGGKEIKKE